MLGIGVFAFFSILEFCGSLDYFFKNFLIINEADSKMIIWLPKIIDFIVFVILIVWMINKYKNPPEINTRKVLTKLIGMFFGIIILQFLFTYYGTYYLMEKYSAEFDLYIEGVKDNYELQSYIAFIPILKYMIFALILLTKRSANNNV